MIGALRGWPARAAIAYGALLGAAWIIVSRTIAIAPEPAGRPLWPGPQAQRVLDARSAAAAFACLRAQAFRAAPPDCPGPTFRGQATLHCRGRALASSVLVSDGARLVPDDGALAAAGAAIGVAEQAGCRLRLDVERGRAPLVTRAVLAPLTSFSLIGGLDGAGVRVPGHDVVLGPDALIAHGLLAAHRLIPGLESRAGLDLPGVLGALATRAALDRDRWRRTPHQVFRLRVESWVESADPEQRAAAVPLLRGYPPAPPATADALRAAARAAADYLVRHQDRDGRFDYEYDVRADRAVPAGSDYSPARHAGAAWFLVEAGAALGDSRFLAAAGRALVHLEEDAPPGCRRPDRACVAAPDAHDVDLGPGALALIAAAAHADATGEPRSLGWAYRLGSFVAGLQRPDGSFVHRVDLDGRADASRRTLYASGQATLALSRLARAAATPPGDRAALLARVDRSLAWLTGPEHAHLAASFYFGEEHWTCLALEDSWDQLPASAERERQAHFCDDYAGFLDRLRFRPGDAALSEQPDLLGAYGFTPLLVPPLAPVGARSEALIAILRLAQRRGRTALAARIAGGLRESLGYLLSRQIAPDGAWQMPDPVAAVGGFTVDDLAPIVRIDTVQHAGAALLRASLLSALAGAGDARNGRRAGWAPN